MERLNLISTPKEIEDCITQNVCVPLLVESPKSEGLLEATLINECVDAGCANGARDCRYHLPLSNICLCTAYNQN